MEDKRTKKEISENASAIAQYREDAARCRARVRDGVKLESFQNCAHCDGHVCGKPTSRVLNDNLLSADDAFGPAK